MVNQCTMIHRSVAKDRSRGSHHTHRRDYEKAFQFVALTEAKVAEQVSLAATICISWVGSRTISRPSRHFLCRHSLSGEVQIEMRKQGRDRTMQQTEEHDAVCGMMVRTNA